MTETHSVTCKRNIQCLVIHLDGICSWKNECNCGGKNQFEDDTRHRHWCNTEPTPPTQEKELCEHCGEPLPCKPIQEIGSKGGWAGGIGTMIPKEEKGLTYDEAIYLGKAMSEKPTQDTESWEEEFDHYFDKVYEVASDEIKESTEQIKFFIKQKKQEWQEKTGRECYDVGKELGIREGKALVSCPFCQRNPCEKLFVGCLEKFQTPLIEARLQEARTQGAEAAVALIDKELRQYVEAYCLDKEIDDVFERAKKV